MKKEWVLILAPFLAAAAIFAVHLATGGGVASAPPIKDKAGLAWFVIASDCPPEMKPSSGPNVWECSGTNDEVEIQAAVDAADGSAFRGSKVKLSAGRFYLALPAGTVTWAGSCETSTVGNVTRLDVGSFTTGTIASVSVGDVVRIYDDLAGTDPADNFDDVCLSVDATSTGPDTITLSGLLQANYDTGDTVNFTRVPFALTLAEGVSLEGDHVGTTRLFLADGESVSGILIPSGANFVTVKDLDVRAETNPNAYDRLRNGIHSDGLENTLENVSVWYVEGDGVTINHGHGFRWTGDSWIEAARGYGVVVVSAVEAILNGVMVTQNYRSGYVINRGTRISILDNYGISALATSGSTIRLNRSVRCVISGCRFENDTNALDSLISLNATTSTVIANNNLRTTTANDILFLENQSKWNTIVGNCFYPDNNSATGLDMDVSLENTIVGNVFRSTNESADMIDSASDATIGMNVVANNVGVLWEDRSGLASLMLNDSGATITARYAVMRTIDKTNINSIEVATDAERIIGIAGQEILNTASGRVMTHGFGTIAVDQNITIVVGDELTLSGTAGVLDLAAGGDIVIGIGKVAQSPGGAGVINRYVYLLDRKDRYVK